MVSLRYLIFFLSIACLTSCDFEKTAKMQENLPRASGKPGDIIVVIDSAQWEGKVGKALKEAFHQPVPHIPREEQMFSLNQIDPRSFQSILKKQKNIIFVTVLGSNSRGNRRLKTYFTKESLKMIDENPSLFMYPKTDEFAKGQELVHLFGETEEILINNISTNRLKLQKHFLEIEEKRTYTSLYSAKMEKGISNHIEDKLGCELKVPLGFEIAREDDRFIWLRNFSPDVDKSIFISWVDYTSEKMFSLDSLLKLRTEISKPYILYKPEDLESYLLTETDNFDVFKEDINFKGQFAVSVKGLWKINKYYMGGPFISYAMVDESTNRLYYIEAFLYSPGRAQRDFMRELGTIIKTFKVPVTPA
jgi:hypothetical protein